MAAENQDARDDVERTWEILKEIGENERHFNQLEHQYRVLASTWLLGVFVATGFVLSRELAFHFPKELIITAIGVLGAVGITLLWILDLRVYHRLLDAYFWAGVALEKYHHAWLPQIRNDMLKRQRDIGVLPRVVWFYVASNTVVLLLGGFSLATWIYNQAGANLWFYAISIVWLLGSVIWGWFIRSTTLEEHEKGAQHSREEGGEIRDI